MATKWVTFLTQYFRDKKKTNPTYKFKQAMIDASKEYKKGASSTASNSGFTN